jgi:lipopolysaccharide biosynthesis glycosyltransferase
MKRAILQVQIAPNPNQQQLTRTFHHIQDLYALSAQQAKKYSEQCDADYVQITDCSFLPDKHPAFQRLKLFEMGQYDQILYLDSDAIFLNNIPNIFELYQGHEFCATMDVNWHSSSAYYKNVKKQVCKRYNASENYLPFCSGVMLMTKEWVNKAKTIYPKYLYEYDKGGYYDQGVMNSCVVDLGEQYTILPEDWGAWYKQGKYIIHLATVKKKNFNLIKFCEKYNLDKPKII